MVGKLKKINYKFIRKSSLFVVDSIIVNMCFALNACKTFIPFFIAKIDPYLEASMGAPSQRTQRTQVIAGTCNPRWNSSMQFFVRNANEDVLCLTVFDKDYFAPNGNITFRNLF